MIVISILNSSVSSACNQLSVQQLGSVEMNSMHKGVTKNIRIEKTSGSCSFIVSFNRGQMMENYRVLKGVNNEVRYGIYRDTSKQNFLGDESFGIDSVLKGDFNQSGYEAKNFTIYFSVDDTQLNKEAGLYRDFVELRLSKTVNKVQELVSATQVPIMYYQQPFYDLTLTSTGASHGGVQHRLDFERLEKGKILGFDILIKSNAPHSLFFSSQNLGRLRHQSLPDQFVPYLLKVQGQDIDLRRGEVSFNSNNFNIDALERLSAQVQIQDVSQAMSGHYRDFISIVIEAR